MNCQDAEKLILLQDSGELRANQKARLTAHLHDCEACERLRHALTEAHGLLAPGAEPSIPAVQNVLRAARLNAPAGNRRPRVWLLKPALATAAALAVVLALATGPMRKDKVGMEIVVVETQLLDTEDQMVSVMHDGYSEDDHAFSFLMTYEDSYASL